MGAWVNASLRISPLEQVAFMRKIANRTLPVSAHAYDMTERITLIDTRPDGWIVHGKTGTGSPGRKYDASHAYGWFVGWAAKGPRKVAFAYLIRTTSGRRRTPACAHAIRSWRRCRPSPNRAGRNEHRPAQRADRPAARRVDRARPAASLQHPYSLRDTSLARVFGWDAVHAIARNGNYGVTMFFVISGYLITSNARRRWGSLGAVDVRAFYVSRIARIVPCLLLLLALVNGLAAAGVPIFQNHAPEGIAVSFWLVNLASLTFWMNVLIGAYGWVNYALGVLWSLSVEGCST